MNSKTYQELCKRTDSPEFNFPNIKLLHAALGMITEAAELADAMKKAIFYGRPLDKGNILEELGDQCWYISQALNELGASWEDIFEANIRKLQKRYPNKFTCEDANHRDLTGEAAIFNDCLNKLSGEGSAVK